MNCPICFCIRDSLKFLKESCEEQIPLLDEIVVKGDILFIQCRIDKSFLSVVFSNNLGVILDRSVGDALRKLSHSGREEGGDGVIKDDGIRIINSNDIHGEIRQGLIRLNLANHGYLVATSAHRPSFQDDEMQLIQDMMEGVGNECVCSIEADHAYRLYLPKSGDTKSPFQPAEA